MRFVPSAARISPLVRIPGRALLASPGSPAPDRVAQDRFPFRRFAGNTVEMRPPVLGLLLACVVLVAGCGGGSRGHQECGPDAAFAACVWLPSLHGRAMADAWQRPRRPLPDIVGSATVTWHAVYSGNCAKDPSTLDVRRGIPASVALFAGDKIYYATDIPLQSRQNPLHDYLFTGAQVAPKRSCTSHAVRGTIAAIDAGGVFTINGRRLRVGSETRLRTDAVDGVPRLRPGTAVTVRARNCHGSVRAKSVTSPH